MRAAFTAMRGPAIPIALGLASPATADDRRPPSAPIAEAAPIFAITYRSGPKWKPGVPMRDQGLREHFLYWKALHARGSVALAGPIGDDGGLVLIHARSQAEADALIAGDPATTAGLFIGAAKPFVPRFVGERTLVPVKP